MLLQLPQTRLGVLEGQRRLPFRHGAQPRNDVLLLVLLFLLRLPVDRPRAPDRDTPTPAATISFAVCFGVPSAFVRA